MGNNNSKRNPDEEKLSQSYELWINNQITDQQYFREVSRIKGKNY